jgi:hypothetical protein
MARTTFEITSDLPDGAEGLIFGGQDAQVTGRYSSSGLTERTYSYPATSEQDGFHIPKMTFKFYDAFGGFITEAPTVKLRVPNNFNVTNFSEYSRTEAIFGAGMEGLAGQLYSEAGVENVGEQAGGNLTATEITEGGAGGLLKYGATAAEAFLYALQKSLAGATGFLTSGGLNGISQAEFTQRAAVNPYAQLLYKGPQFRRYQVPITFRPRNEIEARNIGKIINTFKVASSPSAQNRDISIGGVTETLQSFTFGYPHLTAFSIDFNSPQGAKTLFESKLCAIESVAMDYGGQKMTFFEDGVPTESTMTLQLSEVTVRTLGDAKYDATKGATII